MQNRLRDGTGKKDKVKATLESRRCRGDVEGVEWGAQSVVYRRWKMAA